MNLEKSKPAKARIAFVMHALPHYRKDFFNLLATRCRDDIEFAVFHGDKVPGKRIKTSSDIAVDTFPVRLQAWEILGLRIRRHVHLARQVFAWKPDAVICLFSPGYVSYNWLLLRCNLKGLPYALWGCGHSRPEVTGWKQALRQLIFERFFRKARALIAYGKTYGRMLTAQGYEPQKIFVAQNTIDVKAVAARREQRSHDSCRDLLGWGAEHIVFLFVGAMTREKKLPELVRAFKRLHASKPETRLWLVGSGIVRKNLEEQVRHEKLAGCIHFPGEKYGKDLEPYFVGADVFVLPGTGGLGVNEAMAYGLPVITNYGDGTIPDIVKDGVTGHILSKSEDLVCELAGHLESLANLTRSERQSMGARAQREILAHAPLSEMVEGFRRASKYLLTESSGKS